MDARVTNERDPRWPRRRNQGDYDKKCILHLMGAPPMGVMLEQGIPSQILYLSWCERLGVKLSQSVGKRLGRNDSWQLETKANKGKLNFYKQIDILSRC
jgi:hypothetical protein